MFYIVKLIRVFIYIFYNQFLYISFRFVKKTYARRIKNDFIKASSMSGRLEDQASARGFDYAGQGTYYSLHQLFLSKRGINLIVLDASRDFNDIIKDDDVRHIGGQLAGNSRGICYQRCRCCCCCFNLK